MSWLTWEEFHTVQQCPRGQDVWRLRYSWQHIVQNVRDVARADLSMWKRKNRLVDTQKRKKKIKGPILSSSGQSLCYTDWGNYADVKLILGFVNNHVSALWREWVWNSEMNVFSLSSRASLASFLSPLSSNLSSHFPLISSNKDARVTSLINCFRRSWKRRMP